MLVMDVYGEYLFAPSFDHRQATGNVDFFKVNSSYEHFTVLPEFHLG